MITTEQYLELCETVRRKAVSIAADCGVAERHANGVAAHAAKQAGLASLELAGQMARAKAAVEMAIEQNHVDKLDLSTLPTPNGNQDQE